MNYINFNGEIESATDRLISVSNRSFLYGDGFFETMCSINEKVVFFDDHWERLQNGAKVLKLNLHADFTKTYLQEAINKLQRKNRLKEQSRVRVNIYRQQGGRYLPTTSEAGIVISVEPLNQQPYLFNEIGLKAGLYTEVKKETGELAGIKTCSALLYVMASIYEQEKGWDDCFILNTHSRVIEATGSNLFCVKDGNLFTPPLSEGPVAGVMRKNVIRISGKNGFKVTEKEITQEFLKEADEVFITNAIQGIQWVGEFEGRKYGNKVALLLVDYLRKILNIE